MLAGAGKGVYVIVRSTRGRKENFASRESFTVGGFLDETMRREGEKKEGKRVAGEASEAMDDPTYCSAHLGALQSAAWEPPAGDVEPRAGDGMIAASSFLPGPHHPASAIFRSGSNFVGDAYGLGPLLYG